MMMAHLGKIRNLKVGVPRAPRKNGWA